MFMLFQDQQRHLAVDKAPLGTCNVLLQEAIEPARDYGVSAWRTIPANTLGATLILRLQ